jgi:DNA-binding CsgD family transcriptional regulator
MRELAEIALEARSREEFRQTTMEQVCRALSMDSGALNHTGDGRAIEVHSWGLSVEPLRPHLASYMQEITWEEYVQGLAGHAMDAQRVFSPRRRDSLRLYTEFLVPHGVYGFCSRTWVNRYGVFWMTLSREGRHASYTARDLAAIDTLAPILATGEALHVPRGQASNASEQQWDRAREMGLTRAECQIVALVERGLTNDAIGLLLGRSPNTVRNQLASVFHKVHVSNRAELVFALSNDEHLTRPKQSGVDYLEQLARRAV